MLFHCFQWCTLWPIILTSWGKHTTRKSFVTNILDNVYSIYMGKILFAYIILSLVPTENTTWSRWTISEAITIVYMEFEISAVCFVDSESTRSNLIFVALIRNISKIFLNMIWRVEQLIFTFSIDQYMNISKKIRSDWHVAFWDTCLLSY